MTFQQLSFPPATYYFERPWTLDGITYQCTLRYNLRIDTWFLDLADVRGQLILAGVPLLTGRDLLKQYATLPLPKGLLYVYDASGSNTDPGADSFSLDHALLYASQGA